MIPQLNCFGAGARFHHVGLAVEDITKHVTADQIITDPKQKVKLAFVELNGFSVELLQPLGEDSFIAQSLRKGIKLLHLCYEVNDIKQAMQESRKAGFHCIAMPVMAVAFNAPIAWVFHNDFGLVELLEKSPKNPIASS